MVEFKKLGPKELANEISKKVQDNSVGQKEVVELLHRVKEEMPESFNDEVEEHLRELIGEVAELKEIIRESGSGTGSGTPESSSSWLSFGVFKKLDFFSRFVGILKDGGPYSIIALLFLANVWTALELQKANNRIIDLLITLRVSGRHEAHAPVRPDPTLDPTLDPTPSVPPSPLPILDELALPPGVKERVLQIQSTYQQDVREQEQAQDQDQDQDQVQNQTQE